MRPLERGPIPRVRRLTPAIRDFPVAEAGGNPDIDPRLLEDLEIRRIWNAAQGLFVPVAAPGAPEAPVVEGLAPEERREVVGPEGPCEAQPREQPVPNVIVLPYDRWVEVVGFRHRLNLDEPRPEDQEGPENRNPEEQRQGEGPENQEDPDNQPQH
ncbi:hypothetical protein L5515_015365 [Caenorhabditis briggsae]|uniref:Uncharacterized protein n=1 Tax=Caenorhabditis briggsae TaxID=6238 RepID=A0AAE9J974_CAEBR|nr:hypothetical protein L5515_015365 [Caenorhabditis briggsae]